MIQENSRQRNTAYGDAPSDERYVADGHYVSPAIAPMASSSSSSPSGGLACAIAALAERQQMGGESSFNPNANMSAFNMLPVSSRFNNRVAPDTENYTAAGSSIDMTADCSIAPERDEGEWGVDHGSEVPEAGTSYGSSNVTEGGGEISAAPQPTEIGGSFQDVPGHIVPESFEEQIMLAMAVSLAEARAATSASGVSWQ